MRSIKRNVAHIKNNFGKNVDFVHRIQNFHKLRGFHLSDEVKYMMGIAF